MVVTGVSVKLSFGLMVLGREGVVGLVHFFVFKWALDIRVIAPNAKR